MPIYGAFINILIASFWHSHIQILYNGRKSAHIDKILLPAERELSCFLLKVSESNKLYHLLVVWNIMAGAFKHGFCIFSLHWFSVRISVLLSPYPASSGFLQLSPSSGISSLSGLLQSPLVSSVLLLPPLSFSELLHLSMASPSILWSHPFSCLLTFINHKPKSCYLWNRYCLECHKQYLY